MVATLARFETQSLAIAWSEAPWDSDAIAAPALQITQMEVRGPNAAADFQRFEKERDRLGVALVTCRLAHAQLTESMILEDRGFRFIEMIYRPELELGTEMLMRELRPLRVARAQDDDLPRIAEIAGSAFGHERFHMDPRLGARLGGLRYQNWVRSSHRHPTQRLFALWDGPAIVAFFITEMQPDRVCYWHLTAVAPQAQGRGVGRRAWQTMIGHALQEGATRVRTSVVARNYRVINLYARLGFDFPGPLMTFHWHRGIVS